MPNEKPAHAIEKKELPTSASRSRRSLLATLAMGGFVMAGNLPEKWLRPVVDAVLLPAHAQTSPTESGPTGFRETQGYDIENGTIPTLIPNQTFVFDLGGDTPSGDGSVRISGLRGDLFTPSAEQWTIWLGDIGTGVNLGQTENTTSDCESAPNSVFPVTLAQLQAAASGGTIQISAENGGGIQNNVCASNTMNVTLSFPTE